MDMLTEQMMRVVCEQKLGFVATVDDDGTPPPLTSPAYDIGASETELPETWRAHFAGLEAH